MESTVVFEEKVAVSPTDFNKMSKLTLNDLVLKKFAETREGRCSTHGWVVPGSLNIVSRSMAQIEGGRFTGDLVSWVQIEGKVIYPVDGVRLEGIVLKKNKMGLFVMYQDAIQIMVPRDLHIGNEEFDKVEIGDRVEIELKKSRFQVNDLHILSVGLFIAKTASAPTVATILNKGNSDRVIAQDLEYNDDEEEVEVEPVMEEEVEVEPVMEEEVEDEDEESGTFGIDQ